MVQATNRPNEKHDTKVGVRIPITLKKLITEFVTEDAHLNESDFIRDAIREKIERDAPELYRRLFRIVNDAQEAQT